MYLERMVRDYFSQKVTSEKKPKKSLLRKDDSKCKGPEAWKNTVWLDSWQEGYQQGGKVCGREQEEVGRGCISDVK